MKTLLRFLIAVTSFLVFTTCWASDGNGTGCPQALEMQALDVAGTIRDWGSLYDAYSHFKMCDDGAIAEGFTESVVRMLADDWVSTAKLARLAKRDRQFLDFVYRHINESANENDLEKILANIKTKGCKGISQSICAEIKRRTDAVLKRMCADRGQIPS